MSRGKPMRSIVLGALIGALAAAALTFCSSPASAAQGSDEADACGGVPTTVNVLPFEPVLAYLPHRDLSAMAGEPLAGAVVARAVAALSADGCTLVVGWAAPVVVLATELQADPCAHAHVLRHELQHVRIYLAALGWLPGRIGDLMAGGAAPLHAADQALREVRAAHDELDSPYELRTNHTACGRRIPRLLAGGF